MAPVTDLLIAPTGQTFTQAALSHCRHIIGTETPADSQVRTEIRDAAGRNSWLCWKEQANSQVRQPVHFSGAKDNIFVIPDLAFAGQVLHLLNFKTYIL